MKLFYIISTLVVTGASASELIPAKRMPQNLDTRASFYGGWPLAASTCPSNTTSCDDGSCCPSSSDCYTSGLAGVAVCCPDTSNCVNTVNTLPVCADASWTLYIGNYYYFCCASGQVGILPDKGDSVAAGLCVSSDVAPAASVLATVYQAAGGASATSSSSTPSSTTNPTSTATSPSPTSSTSPSSTGSTAKPSSTSNSSPASLSLSMTATSSSTSSATSSASQSPASAHKSTSKTGPIVGGVVGGVGGLILICLAIWFFGFRRRRNNNFTPEETSYYMGPPGPAEKYGIERNPERNEMPGPMAGNFGLNEVPATQIYPGKDSNFRPARSPAAELA